MLVSAFGSKIEHIRSTLEVIIILLQYIIYVE